MICDWISVVDGFFSVDVVKKDSSQWK